MIEKKIQISKKEKATFSIRIKTETIAALDKIAKETKRSRNELINIFLNYGTENYEIIE